MSIARACKLVEIHRSYYYYQEKRDDTEVEEAIRIAAQYGDGFWKIFKRLRREGKNWNHKKVYRVYKNMHYEKRVRLKKRLPARVKTPLEQPSEPNTTWPLDFVGDVLECGRKFRVLNIMDDSDKVAVSQEVSMSFSARRVIKTLEKVIWLNGKPKNIRCDSGPKFISKERFNGSYRRAVLDVYIFRSIKEVKRVTQEWNCYYNNERPHESPDNIPPMEYRTKRCDTQ